MKYVVYFENFGCEYFEVGGIDEYGNELEGLNKMYFYRNDRFMICKIIDHNIMLIKTLMVSRGGNRVVSKH